MNDGLTSYAETTWFLIVVLGLAVLYALMWGNP
jgi:hypothetical protein